MEHSKLISKCLCCDGDVLTRVLDLGDQPLANSYLTTAEEIEPIFPLAVNYCETCSHTQLTHAVDPDLLFKNYLYVSGTTKTLNNYFDWFSEFTGNYTKGKRVLDIACNDGSQLNSFKSRGYDTYGIDPAVNLHALSSINHKVVCDYFNENSIKKLETKFDIITAQNVFAHNSYPFEFLSLCGKVLEDKGVIFIQTSQADMIQNGQFDTIYHEHISFFSVKSFAFLAKRAGLNLIDVLRTPVHGTSFVFVLSKTQIDCSKDLIKKEKLLNVDLMKEYAKSCQNIAVETRGIVDQLRQRHKVIGYGAAAKGNTFLNFSGIKLDYIVDDNKLKTGLFTPGSRIPITAPDRLKSEKQTIYIVPLAWNFFDEIKERVTAMNLPDVKFLRYFPVLEIC